MGMIYIQQVDYMNVESMQETHESEIQILNEIDNLAIDLDRGEIELATLEAKIDEYIEHVHHHFSSEEKMMQEYDFPAYEMHKMAHDMFLADLEYATRYWKQYGDIKKIINFVRKTPEWIVMHVNSVDSPTADFIAKKQEQLK